MRIVIIAAACAVIAGCTTGGQEKAKAVADSYKAAKGGLNETSVRRWCSYPLAEMRRYWPTAADAMREDCDAGAALANP